MVFSRAARPESLDPEPPVTQHSASFLVFRTFKIVIAGALLGAYPLLSGCVKRVLQKGKYNRDELLQEVRHLVGRA